MKVLFVDDEPDLCDLAKAFLTRANHKLKIETAFSAQEGLEMIKSGEYDAIISDYDMPGMDGLEFFEVLREKGYDMIFIVFTGSGQEGLAERARSVGVDGYYRKGGNPREKFSELVDTVVKNA